MTPFRCCSLVTDCTLMFTALKTKLCWVLHTLSYLLEWKKTHRKSSKWSWREGEKQRKWNERERERKSKSKWRRVYLYLVGTKLLSKIHGLSNPPGTIYLSSYCWTHTNKRTNSLIIHLKVPFLIDFCVSYFYLTFADLQFLPLLQSYFCCYQVKPVW